MVRKGHVTALSPAQGQAQGIDRWLPGVGETRALEGWDADWSLEASYNFVAEAAGPGKKNGG